MFIKLGKNNNFIPMSNVKVFTPENPQDLYGQGCYVILNSGERFHIQDKNIFEVMDSVEHKSTDYTSVVSSFEEQVSKLQEVFSSTINSLAHTSNNIEMLHKDIESKIENNMSKVKQRVNDCVKDVNEATTKYNTCLDGIATLGKDLTSTSDVIRGITINYQDTITKVDEALNLELQAMKEL